jgi:hypothetical protein
VSETGDSVLPAGSPIPPEHFVQKDPVIVAEGDVALAAGSDIAPEHYVDKSNDPKPPTAGELRRLGYVVDDEVPDDAVPMKYMGDQHLAPPAPAEEDTGDQLAAPGTLQAAEEHVYEPPPEETHPQYAQVQAELDAERSKEYREGVAAAKAGDERKSPYDGRARQGKDWYAGYDSVDE